MEIASTEVDKTSAALTRARAEYRQACYQQAQEEYWRARQAEFLERQWCYRRDANDAAAWYADVHKFQVPGAGRAPLPVPVRP